MTPNGKGHGDTAEIEEAQPKTGRTEPAKGSSSQDNPEASFDLFELAVSS